MESSTRAHEQAKAAGFDIELPEYPADGSQICKARCRCRWEIEREKRHDRGVLDTERCGETL